MTPDNDGDHPKDGANRNRGSAGAEQHSECTAHDQVLPPDRDLRGAPETNLMRETSAGLFPEIAVSRISAKNRLRALNEEGVTSLMRSMTVCRMINPIVVRDDGSLGYTLVAGAHRLEAATRLGWTTVQCRVVFIDDSAARLMEIDENLVRAELTPAETAIHLVVRKDVFESVHGAARAKAAHAMNATLGRSHDANAKLALTFVADTADKTALSERTVQRHLARAAIGCQQLHGLVGTSLDVGAELDALVALQPEDREELINRAVAGEPVSAINKQKLRKSTGVPEPDNSSESRHVKILKRTWLSASSLDREVFMAWATKSA